MAYGNELQNTVASCLVKKQGAVDSALGALEDHISYLQKDLCQLEERLRPAMTSAPDESSGGVSAGYGCALANRIQSAAIQVEALTTSVREILVRLEL